MWENTKNIIFWLLQIAFFVWFGVVSIAGGDTKPVLYFGITLLMFRIQILEIGIEGAIRK